jgi:hypothetical protein
LLVDIWPLRAAHRPVVRQARVVDHLRALLVDQVGTVAGHIVMQLLLTRGLVGADPSAGHVSRQEAGRLIEPGCATSAVFTRAP